MAGGESQSSDPRSWGEIGAGGFGVHLIADLFGATGLDDLKLIEAALRACAIEASATILQFHIQHFTPNNGVSAVAMLAESHLSIHTWPETGFAAFDAFMCGSARPTACLPILQSHFSPLRMVTVRHDRGLLSTMASSIRSVD